MHRRKTQNPKLSLIIPVYNERRRLEKGLKHALEYLNKKSYSWEIIVVDDGSVDNVPKLIPKEVSYLRTARNFGKGHAIRLGVEAAEGDYIFFSDIDFSVNINYLPIFIDALKNHDLAIGSRRLRDSYIARHQSSLREVLGRGFTTISNLFLGLNHTDHTCGFKGFKKTAAKKLFSLCTLNRWAFDSEILYLAKKNHFKVVEIPITWKNDTLSKVNIAQDVLTSFWSLVKIRLE